MAGAVATARLTLVYVPSAIAIDHLATRMVELKAQQLDTDEITAEELQWFRSDVTADRSVRDRLQTGLSIAAPLTGVLFTAFVLRTTSKATTSETAEKNRELILRSR